jgi:hypothetical protein
VGAGLGVALGTLTPALSRNRCLKDEEAIPGALAACGLCVHEILVTALAGRKRLPPASLRPALVYRTWPPGISAWAQVSG